MTDLTYLLQQATPQERALLSQILHSSDADPGSLAECLQRVSSSFFAYRIRKVRLSYTDVVNRVAEQLGVWVGWRSDAAVERAIADRIWSSVWERMTPKQQEEFNRKLIESARNTGQLSNLKGVAVAGGGLLAANASGFGVYMLASSALGALTAGLGFTLPFGVYMAMSSTLSIILGPVGFIGLGLLALHKITGPEHQKMATAVVAICAIRSRIDMERRQKQPQGSRWNPWVLGFAAVLALCFCVWLALGSHVPGYRP
jgi:uncharacterized protein YaaW (UPF0174 family)